MEEVKLTIFHITWNINSLNFDTNKNYLVVLQKLLVFIRNTPKMLKKMVENNERTKIYQVNTNKKKARMTVLILGKVEFIIKNTKQDTEDYRVNDKRQKDAYIKKLQ